VIEGTDWHERRREQERLHATGAGLLEMAVPVPTDTGDAQTAWADLFEQGVVVGEDVTPT
jgi:hypothetical protein